MWLGREKCLLFEPGFDSSFQLILGPALNTQLTGLFRVARLSAVMEGVPRKAFLSDRQACWCCACTLI